MAHPSCATDSTGLTQIICAFRTHRRHAPGWGHRATWVCRGIAACPLNAEAFMMPGERERRAANNGGGGEGGIRTPDTVTRMPHFECGAFNHSATSPWPRSAGRLPVGRYVSNGRG